MSQNWYADLMVPREMMLECAKRERALRLSQNETQAQLAHKVGISLGTLKRFERTGEISFEHLLGIALMLGRLRDFDAVFALPDVPKSLFEKEPAPRQRARQK